MCQPKPESPWQQVTEREAPVLKCLLVKTIIPRHWYSEHTHTHTHFKLSKTFTPAGLERASALCNGAPADPKLVTLQGLFLSWAPEAAQ